VDAGEQARFEQGNVVGDLAMGIFDFSKEKFAENIYNVYVEAIEYVDCVPELFVVTVPISTPSKTK